MKVSYCENCPYSERLVWSQYYRPNGYHAIGINHAYRYCMMYKDRCSEVKKSECYRYQVDHLKKSNGRNGDEEK